MKILELYAEKRKIKKSKAVKKLRLDGQIPAILYGHKQENVMLSVKADHFGRILNTKTRTINLNFDNKKESALIKEVQYDNLTDKILHVDFSRIDLGEKVKLRVPILLLGEAAGVKEGGVLTHVLKSIEIECMAIAIPENIKVNINELGLGNTIHVRELPVLEGIEYLVDPETVVVTIHHAAEEKEVSEEEMLAEPEVITKKAKEEAESEE